MYQITVINHYHDTLLPSFGSPIPKGDSRPVKSKPMGSGYVTVPGLGAVNFTDVGDRQIGGYSKATWGVLVSYQGEEVVFRYEGSGEIAVTINSLGQAELSSNGALSQISLGSFHFK